MVRRSAGEGSIFRRTRDGRWIAQLSSGPRGHRTTKIRVATTKPEARKLLSDLRADRDAALNPTTLSLGAYLRRWLDETAKPSISPNTFRGYEDVLAHLRPIADIPLTKLTAEDIEGCLARMQTRRIGSTPKPASPKTIRNVQIMLRRALSQAEERGRLRRNVAKMVPLRRVPRRHKDAMTPDLAHRILAAVKGDRYEAAYALAMLGLRASEVLGLARSDLHLDDRWVDVRWQIVGSGKRAKRAQLKSVASEAPVPLPPFAEERLRAHLDSQPTPIGDALVFVTVSGLAVNGSWLTKHFAGLMVASGLPRLTLHDLRHGAVALLIGAGVHPRVAQELVRHASSRTTMEVYGHVSASQMREAVDLLQRAVAG